MHSDLIPTRVSFKTGLKLNKQFVKTCAFARHTCLVNLVFYLLGMCDHFISEMAQKAAAVKRLEKVQRQAALEAVKMAKRERGFYKIHIFIIC